MTAQTVAEHDVVVCVGDTTFIDYDSIAAKREGKGPIGNGGNGLILHSAKAYDPQLGQPLGLLWQKLWNREPKQQQPKDETPTQKKKRRAAAQIAARLRPFEQKESYRWVEALTTVESQKVKHQWTWMLLTTEIVADAQMAAKILRWYSYRWPVEEYHKILKSGCQVERHRLAADGMKTLLGFLSVIAVELLQLTYLHRTQPTATAISVLNSVQLEVMIARITQITEGVNS